MKSQIVALAFEGETMADVLLTKFEELQVRGLLTVEDAVIASRGSEGAVEIRQTRPWTKQYAGRGLGVGALAGLLLGGPIAGAAAGTAVGAVVGKMKDHGIDDSFVDEVSQSLGPDSSILFLLIRLVSGRGKEVLAELQGLDAAVLTTTLTPDQEQMLRDALAGG